MARVIDISEPPGRPVLDLLLSLHPFYIDAHLRLNQTVHIAKAQARVSRDEKLLCEPLLPASRPILNTKEVGHISLRLGVIQP